MIVSSHVSQDYRLTECSRALEIIYALMNHGLYSSWKGSDKGGKMDGWFIDLQSFADSDFHSLDNSQRAKEESLGGCHFWNLCAALDCPASRCSGLG